MFKNYFKTTLRSFGKNRVFALINIFGLSIGLTAAIFIFQYTYFQFSFFIHFTNHSQINQKVFWAHKIIFLIPRKRRYKLRFRIKWNMAAIWIFSRHAVFGDFSTPKAKRCFGIKVRHWINLSYATDFWSLPKLLTEICPF